MNVAEYWEFTLTLLSSGEPLTVYLDPFFPETRAVAPPKARSTNIIII